MKNFFYIIDPNCEGFEDSALALFDKEGNLFHVFDVYHGENLDYSFAKKLGIKFEELPLSSLVSDEEAEADFKRTDRIPAQDLVVERIKKFIKEKND